MKIVLVALSSYCEFTYCLAAGYLKAYLLKDIPQVSVKILSLSLKEHADISITGKIMAEHPDMVGFSCYAMNIRHILDIAGQIKSLNSGIRIVLGGPEAGERSKEYLESCSSIDIIVRGEGELTFSNLVRSIIDGKGLVDVRGISYASGGKVTENPGQELISSLDEIPSPYLTGAIEINTEENALVETFRGCPYRCAYCFEGKNYPVIRHFSAERIVSEISLLKSRGVREVNLVNSTFNSDRERMREICTRLAEINRENPVRIVADLKAEIIDGEAISLLRSAGIDTCEIGLQSVDRETNRNINRVFDPEKFLEGFSLLKGSGFSICIDIICGLPGDNFFRFARTIRFVEQCRPNTFSGAFLQLLPGSLLRKDSARFDIAFDSEPPYEIISNSTFPGEEVARAKALSLSVSREYHTRLR